MKKCMETISEFMERFEKHRSYPITPEGLARMKMDIKADKIGKYMNIAIYGTLIVLVIVGILGQKFIITYTVGTITSKTVKLLMA